MDRNATTFRRANGLMLTCGVCSDALAFRTRAIARSWLAKTRVPKITSEPQHHHNQRHQADQATVVWSAPPCTRAVKATAAKDQYKREDDHNQWHPVGSPCKFHRTLALTVARSDSYIRAIRRSCTSSTVRMCVTSATCPRKNHLKFGDRRRKLESLHGGL